MGNTRRRIAMAISGLAGACGLVFAFALPALAAGPYHETSGNYAIGAPSVSPGAVVKDVSLPGRTINCSIDGTFHTMDRCVLQITAGGGNTCIQDVNHNAVIGPCSGASGIEWGLNLDNNGNVRFVNVSESASSNHDLSGFNNGTQFKIQAEGNGTFQRFTP